MGMQFDFYAVNVIAVFFSLVSWAIIFSWAYRVYYNRAEKPKSWKVVLVFWIGLFSFSGNFPIGDTVVKVALLPLGVWILYGVLHKKNEGESWLKYRQFAWIGFFANYLFMLMAIATPFAHDLFYEEKDISTYIAHGESASLLRIHDSAPKATFNLGSFKTEANMDFDLNQVSSIDWYNETIEALTDDVKEERFPFALIGTEPKWGSGVSSYIFIERDGKGILISTPKEQLYFRTAKPIISFEEGRN